VNRRATFSSLFFGAIVCLLVALPLPAWSQGCALCYTQAASAGQKMIEALRSGILVLIVPPTLASVAMIFVVHRKRNHVRRPEDGDESAQDW
jgi:hypothetical protein